jgi:hypothetical protein
MSRAVSRLPLLSWRPVFVTGPNPVTFVMTEWHWNRFFSEHYGFFSWQYHSTSAPHSSEGEANAMFFWISAGTGQDRPTTVAAPSRAWTCGRSLVGIVGSNPTGGHECLSLMSVVACQVEVSATDRSLVQRSPTACGVSKWVWSWNLKNGEALLHDTAVEPQTKNWAGQKFHTAWVLNWLQLRLNWNVNLKITVFYL